MQTDRIQLEKFIKPNLLRRNPLKLALKGQRQHFSPRAPQLVTRQQVHRVTRDTGTTVKVGHRSE